MSQSSPISELNRLRERYAETAAMVGDLAYLEDFKSGESITSQYKKALVILSSTRVLILIAVGILLVSITPLGAYAGVIVTVFIAAGSYIILELVVLIVRYRSSRTLLMDSQHNFRELRDLKQSLGAELQAHEKQLLEEQRRQAFDAGRRAGDEAFSRLEAEKDNPLFLGAPGRQETSEDE